jgi:SAM-dependent methyltransferase
VRYEEEYAAYNSTWHLEDAPHKVDDVLRSIARASLRPTSVCDIGCGIGEVLAQLHIRLTLERAVGYDVSQYAITRARKRETDGLRFRVGDPTLDGESFDLMLMLDVIEHVADPVAFLTRVKDKAPLAIMNIPLELSAQKVLRGRSLARGRRGLGHLHYFNEHLVQELLTETGYRVRDAWISPPGTGRLPDPTRRWLRAAQRTAARAHPSLAARTIGGCSLMIVATSRTASAGQERP